jgi:phosphatidate cytidylyltransferase
MPDPYPDDDPSSLRAAHRARHAAAPETYPDLDGWPTLGGDEERFNGSGRDAAELDADLDAAKDGSDDWYEWQPSDAVVGDETSEISGVPPIPQQAPAPPVKRTRRAGRNLPAAIAVGVGLAGTIVASLVFWKPAFFLLVLVAITIGTVEMVRAVWTTGPRPPLVPLLLGVPVILGLAWYGGAEALPYGLLGTAIAVLVWRLADGPENYQRDAVSALLIAGYVPFLAGFAVLLAQPHDGAVRVLVTFAAVALSDTGGYVVGVLFGRRSMAPTVSPGKSWEGFAGSLVAASATCALLLHLVMGGATWWKGAVFGLAVAIAATLGDLAESLLKRDLGVKDMSNLLPGHGGLMDRLDSILLAAPAAYAVLTLFLPPG